MKISWLPSAAYESSFLFDWEMPQQENFKIYWSSLILNSLLGVLIKIFDNIHNGYDKLKIKILTLLHDLIIERDTAAGQEDEASQARLAQYRKVW